MAPWICWLWLFTQLPSVLNVCLDWHAQAKKQEQVKAQVLSAMAVVAEAEVPGGLSALMDQWGQDPEVTAEAIVSASCFHQVDPVLLVALAWKESKFKVTAEGDFGPDGLARNCGPTQVRVSIRGRPSCSRLKEPYFAYHWTAKFLRTYGLNAYNGGSYARRVASHTEWISHQVRKRRFEHQIDLAHRRASRGDPAALSSGRMVRHCDPEAGSGRGACPRP